MAYTATKNPQGSYEVSLNGQRVATGSAGILGNYGLSEANLGGTTMAGTTPSPTTIGAPIAQSTTPSTPMAAPIQSATPQQQVVQSSQPVQSPTPPTQPKPAVAPADAAAAPLVMPASGSVIDVLNMAGQDSSFAARKQLAQEYGIQGYAGTAQQNQELSKRFIDIFNASKGKPVPQNGAEARSAIQAAMEESKISGENAEQNFFDEYMTMNPVVKTLYDSINQMLSAPTTNTTFKEEFTKLQTEQGIPALQTELMNINNIMDGTDDDIRTEIAKVGGFATESQVQALTGARNKTLLKQANNLFTQLALKEDYVDQLMQFSQLDRKEVNKQVDRKLGLTEKLAKIQESITTAAKDNYQKIVDTVGYGGLASAFQGDKGAMSNAEQMLGLPKGILSNPTAMKYLKPQIEPKPLQFVSATDNQAGGVFDPNTGTFTARGGGAGGSGFVPSAIGMPSYINETGKEVEFGSPEYIRQVITDSTKYGKTRLLADERKNITAAKRALGSIEMYNQIMNGTLDEDTAEEVFGAGTGVVQGRLRTLAANWGGDANAAAINAVIQGIIPTVARGIFQEVGVLTDQDIANYRKTVPDINKPENANKLIELVLLNTLERAYADTLLTAAQNQTNVSNFAAEYDDVVSRLGTLRAPSKQSLIQGTFKGQPGAVQANELSVALKEGFKPNFTTSLSSFPGLTSYKK